MNPTETDIPLFKRLRFVLVETSRAGNVGSVSRAMKTMGFADLVLVAPRCEDPLHDPEAVAFASGALDVLQGARIVGTIAAHLEQALVAIGFLDAGNPKKLMPRLKRLFARTQLETEEVNILRGIARQMMRGKEE